jgi:demethylmenaquinone methyltransferase/2-methoxy-6-polyprenyl-1,4-benzoquinol methylase
VVFRPRDPNSLMDKRTFVRRGFAAIAGSYDLLNTLLSFGMDAWWRHKAIKALGFSGQGLVLDACAGTMRLEKGILRRHPGARVTALDFSLAMLGRGQTRIQRAAIAPTGGDAESLPFRAETFDRAIIGFGVRNLADQSKGIEEFFRVLKRRGSLVILEFGRPTLPVFKQLYQWYLSRFIPWAGGVVSGQKEVYRYLHESIMTFPEPTELMAMMHKAGLSQIRCRRLTGGIAHLYIGEKALRQ